MENESFQLNTLGMLDPIELEKLYLERHVPDDSLTMESLDVVSTDENSYLNEEDDDEEDEEDEYDCLESYFANYGGTVNCPGSMTVKILALEMDSEMKNPLALKLTFRGKTKKTPYVRDFNRLLSLSHEFTLSYHSILFDILKIDICKQRQVFRPSSTQGRVKLKLSALPLDSAEFTCQYPILPKRPSIKSFYKHNADFEPAIGKITLEFTFYPSDLHINPILLPQTLTKSFLESSDDPSSTSSVGSSASGIREFYSYIEKGYIEDSPGVPSLTTESPTLSINADSKSFHKASANTLDTRPDSHREKRYSERPRNRRLDGASDRFRSYSSTSTYSQLSSSVDTKYSRTKGSFLSERTKYGMKELVEFMSSFFKNGWPISKMDCCRSLLMLSHYYDNYYQQTRTYDHVSSTDFIVDAEYWLRFAMAAYGTFIVNWCGHGNGYLVDVLQIDNDRKVAIKTLDIQGEDLLGWEIGQDEMFKPHFLVCRDRRTESIVIAIRGTWSIADALTDLCAEYEPFMQGYAHRGFLRCAQWIDRHYMDKIIGWIHTFKYKKLNIIGHSLGGAIAPILTMILKETVLPILNESLPGFQIRCITFAAPPSVSKNICDFYMDDIDAFVNENDAVPRLSIGILCDFKELVVETSKITKMKISKIEKLETIDSFRRKLQKQSVHPQLFIPGKVFYIYKTSRAQPKYFAARSSSLKHSTPRRVKEETPHYVIERSSADLFLTLPLKTYMLTHHFPNRYDKGLHKSREWIDKNRNE